jgi:hypothetical protein
VFEPLIDDREPLLLSMSSNHTLSRRTWSLAHSTETLGVYVAWGQTYYNFLRFHEALRIRVNNGKRFRSRTPTMAARLTRKRWPVQELLTRPLVV